MLRNSVCAGRISSRLSRSAVGLGMYSIATRLNKAGVPAFVGKTDGTGRTLQRLWPIVRCLESFSHILRSTETVSLTESRSPITFRQSFPSRFSTKPSTGDLKGRQAERGRVGKALAIPTYLPAWRGARIASRRSRLRTKDRAVEAAAISFAAMHSAASAVKRLGGVIRISRLLSLHLLKSSTLKASSTQTRMPKRGSGLRVNGQGFRANCRQ